MIVKTVFLVSLSILLLSCGTSSKKERKSVFDEDSKFLKQDYKIENFEPVVDNKKDVVAAVEEKAKKKSKTSLEIKDKQNKGKSKSTDKALNPLEKTKAVVGDLPFYIGEKVVLSASFFAVEAGKITIGVDDFKKIDGKKVYNFYAVGKTSSVFSLFYKIQNKIESLWNPKIMKPVSLAFDAKESKQKYKSRVYFDWKKKKASFAEEGWSKKKGDYQKKGIWKLLKPGQDIVSAIFYARTFPLIVGKTYNVTVFEDSKMIDVGLTVDRSEVLKTRMGKLNTLVLKPSFSTNGKFQKSGDISVWVTDDKYRQVVRIETKIKIGTVVAKLHSWNRPK